MSPSIDHCPWLSGLLQTQSFPQPGRHRGNAVFIQLAVLRYRAPANSRAQPTLRKVFWARDGTHLCSQGLGSLQVNLSLRLSAESPDPLGSPDMVNPPSLAVLWGRPELVLTFDPLKPLNPSIFPSPSLSLVPLPPPLLHSAPSFPFFSSSISLSFPLLYLPFLRFPPSLLYLLPSCILPFSLSLFPPPLPFSTFPPHFHLLAFPLSSFRLTSGRQGPSRARHSTSRRIDALGARGVRKCSRLPGAAAGRLRSGRCCRR